VDYPKLRTELTTDPVTLGYAPLTDQAAADKLNATNTGRTRNRTAVGTDEVLNQIDDAAWPTTAILQNKLQILLERQTVDASNTRVRGIFAAIFPNSGGTAATLGRLNALGTETVSRATELGLEFVQAVDVQRARAGKW
jgi:hypothetical protein